jgi:hypothetical protein
METWYNLKTAKKLVLVVNIDYNMSAASGVPIAVKGKWRLRCKGHSVVFDRTSKTHSLASWIPGLHATSNYGDVWMAK